MRYGERGSGMFRGLPAGDRKRDVLLIYAGSF
jgi:hypothetical protein